MIYYISKNQKEYVNEKKAAIILEQIRELLLSENLKKICKLNEQSFTRSRLLPFPILVSYIANFIRRSLQFEISSFASFMDLPDVSKQAFSKARKNLSPVVFQLLNAKLIDEFYSDNEFKLFKGMRVCAIDGSTIRLPENDELYKEFGAQVQNGNKIIGVPLAKTSVLYDVLNEMMLHTTLVHYNTSEKKMAIEHLEALSKLNDKNKINDLIMFDRGYPSAFLMFYMLSLQKHFLMRVNNKFIKNITDAVQAGARDIVVSVPPCRKYHLPGPEFAQYMPHIDKTSTIQVRVAVFDLSSGEKEIIVTSLLDKEKFTYDDLFKLYNKRWNIEENYKLIKCVAHIENFSGESKVAILQDFFATVFTCNIASLLSQEAQEELKQESADNIKNTNKYSYKINRNLLIGTIKNEILEVLLGNNNLEEYCNKLKQRIKRSLISIRPGRSFDRPRRYTQRYPFIHNLLNSKRCL